MFTSLDELIEQLNASYKDLKGSNMESTKEVCLHMAYLCDTINDMLLLAVADIDSINSL